MNTEEAAWNRLEAELDQWTATPGAATFWWRDDDAIEPTPQLDLLLACAQGCPVALSVIPEAATESLAHRLCGEPDVHVLQHGWRHNVLTPDGWNEYPPGRSLSDVSREIAMGKARLEALFGEQTLPIFVPPFHAFDADYLPLLAANGISAISGKGPRAARLAAPGLRQINGHVALVVWTSPPSFGPAEGYLDALTDHLRQRRMGLCDPDEATGLITHHLDQSPQSMRFVRSLVAVVRDHPGSVWLDASSVVRLAETAADWPERPQ